MIWNDVVRLAVRRRMDERGETVRSLAAKIGRSANWTWKRLAGQTEMSLEDLTAFGSALDFNPAVMIATTYHSWKGGEDDG